ncbi:MAG: aspartate aminotransferase [Myxococcales bacterium]|nr:aspartate aminotransferase [Myxococcales bacterium]
MPRYPDLNPFVSQPNRSSYSTLAALAYHRGGQVYPLHIGDTWLEPAIPCRMESLTIADHPGMHTYSPVQGRMELRRAIAERTRMTGDQPADVDEILVTAGATAGLFALAAAMLKPGDEVLVIAPYWPLIGNAIKCAGGQVIPIPFFETAKDTDSVIETLNRHITSKTVAIYWNTPHNPTGRLIPRDWLAAMAAWATQKQLWIVSDEVYEDYVFSGQHSYSRPFAPDRTISAYSFSKAYGMAGNRVGYLIGPAAVMNGVQRISRNSFYSVNTAGQIAAEIALGRAGQDWVNHARDLYRELGQYAASTLGVDEPEGSTFLFVDVKGALDERGLNGFLQDCAKKGLLVAPGSSFGPYDHHIRVCFTCAPPEVVRQGIQILSACIDQ